MVRLLVRPDGSFVEVVFASEVPEDVERATAKLLDRYPDTVVEEYTTDDYEAMRPDRGTLADWRRQGEGIVVVPQSPAPHPRQDLLDEVDKATTVAALRAVVRKVIE